MQGSWLVVGVGVVLGFFIGAVNPATIIASARHVDLRQGSGNPGATNAGRVLGVRWGVAVGALDVIKGLVPTLLALWLGDRLTAYAVGLACVLGHVLSPFLRGRGGKGVATSMGAVIAVFPWFALGMCLVFGLMLWRTRWVAGASLAVAGMLGLYAGLGPLPEPVAVGRAWGITIAVLVIARHHDNIRQWVRRRLA
jgi:acyl phosphate:glycerol-3-phosphate acyltransferase